MTKPRVTSQQRVMAREFRRLGPAFISPEWADCDGFEDAVEQRAAEMMANPDCWGEILERGAGSAECRQAAALFSHQFHSAGNGEAEKSSRDFNVVLYEIAVQAAIEELEPT